MKTMYVACYSYDNFYIDRFEMGANAYREDLNDGSIEKLRVVSVLSSSQAENIVDECLSGVYDEHDHAIVFTDGNVKYLIIFDSDYPVDELPKIDNLIYC